ncbi:hypothetical protein GHT06_014983 [Daphnia sinensis]|uniref:C2H2-type domain-containing protein n=1 Tax=Daphnia sinensis TaxID=1820382 RepID=A0AAD5LA95_9CRUS|nr:hypothetical protein GHT06_014983 [Daphnia sinensis]
MTSSSPPPLIPIHGYNHIHHAVVNPSANRQMETQVGTSFDPRPYDVVDVHDQQYDEHWFAQNEDLATRLPVNINEPEFYPLQRSNHSDTEFSTGLLCHHYHPSQDNDHRKNRASNGKKLVADVDCYWYRRNLRNIATIDCLTKKIRTLQKKLKITENIEDVQVNVTQLNAVEWKKKDEIPRKMFHCTICHKKYTSNQGLRLHTQRKHGKTQTACSLFTDTMTPPPDVQRKQSDSDHHGGYSENGRPEMSPQVTLITVSECTVSFSVSA